MAGSGGAWKVAYADFVTAMMAFFLVMWITAQNKSVKESVAQYFNDPLGTALEARATSVHGIKGASAKAEMVGQQAGPHGSDRREIGTNELTGNAENLPKKRPEIRIFNRLDRTRTVGTMVLFPVTTAELNTEGRVQLSALVPELLGKPNKVEIRAHAVRGPLPRDSEFADNWELCFARAKRVRDYLIGHGVDMRRIRMSLDGDNEPYSHDVNQVDDVRNARVEVFAVSEFSNTLKDPIEKRVGDFIPAPIGEELAPAFPTTPTEGAHSGGGEGGHGHGEGDAGHGGGHGEAAPAHSEDAHGHGGGHGH